MEERRLGLKRFLAICLAHPQIGNDVLLTTFLNEMDGATWKLVVGDPVQREHEPVQPQLEFASLTEMMARVEELKRGEDETQEEREWIKQTRAGLLRLSAGMAEMIKAFGQLSATRGRSLNHLEEAVGWVKETGELESCAHRLAQTCSLLATLQRQLGQEIQHSIIQQLLLLADLINSAVEMLDRHAHSLFNDFDSLTRHLIGVQAQLERVLLATNNADTLESDHLRLSLHRSLSIYQHHLGRNRLAHERVQNDLAWLHAQWQLILKAVLVECTRIMEQHTREQHQQWSRLLMLIAP